jgi:L-alanine-DL-glutamate epimerase-like enolase superfamily enzyme
VGPAPLARFAAIVRRALYLYDFFLCHPWGHPDSPLYWPKLGSLELPDLPGLGFSLDEEKVEARESVSF